MHLRRPIFYSLLFSFCSTTSASSGSKASLCGYLVSEHDPKSVYGKIATAAMELNPMQALFPTVATLSVVPTSNPQIAENHIVQILDGTIRTGKARFSDGTVRRMETDLESSDMVRDVDIVAVHIQKRYQVEVSPVTALVDSSGDIHLVVDQTTKLAQQIAVHVRDHYGFALPHPPAGKFYAVSMVEIGESKVRVFGLTEQHLYSMDLDVSGNTELATSNAEWKIQTHRTGARFVRALSQEQYLIADESGNVEFYSEGNLIRTVVIPGTWLSSISAYAVPDASGLPSARFATLSYSKDEVPKPLVHLWKDGKLRHVPLDFPEGEAPVALAFTGMQLTAPQLWWEWRQKAVYESGYLSEWNQAEGEVQRLILMSRKGNNYLFRGVQGWNKPQLKLSSFPWYFIGPNNGELEKSMIQAGFNFPLLREQVDINTDMGASGQKLVTRLKDAYGFHPFDPLKPGEYKGEPNSVIRAWVSRLGALRDLRLASSGIAQSIVEEGIFEHRDQLLVYELMNFEERENTQDFEMEESVPLGDREWMELFLDRLTNQASPLVQSSRYNHNIIRRYYRKELMDLNWRQTALQDYNQLPEPVKPLYLVAQHYLDRPFKYVVKDYLSFSEANGGVAPAGTTPEIFEIGRKPYWEMLANYLESVDPLRAVVNNDSLIYFLTTQPTEPR